MKRKLYALALLMAGIGGAEAQNTPVSQMEKLTRGVVSVPATSGAGRFISWRFLGTDPANTTFDVLCDGVTVKSGISDKTNFVHTTGAAGKKYQIVTKVNGEIVETSDEAMVFDDIYKQLPLDKPADGTNIKGYTYSYTPNDCSVGDVDGDGEYEIILKWDPSNSQDNGHADSGSDEWTGNVLLDCYKLDGTKLWRIDLGKNIRAGAHYTQFLVYDFDGDGKAEVICKTAPGSIDGQGGYVNQAATDETIKAHNNTATYYNGSGHVLSGAEYLTVFNGETGKAVHTIWYNPNRAGTYNKVGAHPSDKSFWGDNYGNRSERYLACVAHLDGADKNASAVMVRGYYTRAYLWAVDFDGSELKTKWLHASVSGTKAEHYDADWNMTSKVYTTNARGGSGSKTMYSNGNHNISVADVDGDGCDEILYGSAALDNDGMLLYAVGFGHGDAIHVSDLVPSRPGLEVFDVHEDGPHYGWDLHDAATGEIIYSATSSGDNGRGLAADIDATNPGAEFCSASDRQIRSAMTGEVISTKSTSVNFRAYWDGDLQEELLDGNQMDKWNGNGTSRIYPKSGKNFYDIANSSTCNSTKKTPNLLADILGDWREELILWDGSTGAALNIFTTNVETSFRVPTLMHDHVYRMGVAWQNTAYNQPPHLGYYLPNLYATTYTLTGEGAFEQTVGLGESIKPIEFVWSNCTTPSLLSSEAPDGTKKTGSTPVDGFKFTRSIASKTIKVEGTPQMLGTYKLVIKSGSNVVDKQTRNDTILVHCVDPSGIQGVSGDTQNDWVSLAGGVMTDRIVLNFNMKKAQNVHIGIYTMAGAQVFGIDREIGYTAPLEIYGLGHLPKGVYMLKVESGEGTFTKKLLKR